MSETLIIFGMAAVTFAVRFIPLAASGKIEFPEPVLKSLKFVPAAVLAAIIFQAVFFPTGQTLQLSWKNPYLVAGIASAIISWRTKKLLRTILLGMGFFLVWKWLVAWIA
jgi:branched chain amino acid efflux pump